MGFLKKFFRNVFREGSMPVGTSSFERLSEEELEAHLGVARYGNFMLSDAVRPSYDLQVVPTQGYRHDAYRDHETKVEIPVLMASVSRDRVLDVFLDLLDPLGYEVDVVLETSHEQSSRGHQDLYREHIDLPVLKSTLYDFEDLLLDDGCTGIAVLNPNIPMEVQFDEHKLLVIYARDLKPFEQILIQAGLKRNDRMKLITEGEHLHSTDPRHVAAFEQLCYRIGVGEAAEHVNW